MKSGATNHFPPVKLLPNRKELWNRIERRSLQIRPEERVRLRYIDHLTLECGVPASRIATEQTLPQTKYSSALRADLICYDERFNPEILIECKAESVNLNREAAEQIARYNRDVQAPILCITNGIEDYWFRTGQDGCEPLQENPLQKTRTLRQIRLEPDYWAQRGFTGATTEGETPGPEWMVDLLSSFWSDHRPWDATWVDVGKSTKELHLDHTYRIVEEDEHQIAVTIMAGIQGETWITALYNLEGETYAVAGCSLQRLAGEELASSWRIDAEGRHEFSFPDNKAFYPEGDPEVWVDNLPSFLDALLKSKPSG